MARGGQSAVGPVSAGSRPAGVLRKLLEGHREAAASREAVERLLAWVAPWLADRREFPEALEAAWPRGVLRRAGFPERTLLGANWLPVSGKRAKPERGGESSGP